MGIGIDIHTVQVIYMILWIVLGSLGIAVIWRLVELLEIIANRLQ